MKQQNIDKYFNVPTNLNSIEAEEDIGHVIGIHKQPSELNHIKPFINQYSETDRWNFTSRRKSKKFIQSIFTLIKSAPKLTYLWLYWNQIPTIIVIIKNTKMENLKTLNLGANLISSVTELIKVEMQNLEELLLWNNKITNIDILRKLRTPSLKSIDVSSNHIVECPKFSELFSNKMQRINIQQNHMFNINDFMKILAFKKSSKILLFDNQFVKIGTLYAKKNKKVASNFNLFKNKVVYC